MEDVYASNTKPYSDANEKIQCSIHFESSLFRFWCNQCMPVIKLQNLSTPKKNETLIHLKLWNLYLSKLKKCELQNTGGWHAENSTLSYTFINYKDRSYIAPPFSKWKGL